MLAIDQPLNEIPVPESGNLPDGVIGSGAPVILRGLVSHWPITRSGLESPAAVESHLLRFYAGASVTAVYSESHHRGRVFYDEKVSGFNFKVVSSQLDKVLDEIRQQSHAAEPMGIYMGSTEIDRVLPGFRSENELQFDAESPLAFIWLGNHSRIAAHFDLPDNIACCVAGRRRFTLFPPSEIGNLYPGPMDKTPAGQIVSMVDFKDPDFERFPKFRNALEKARVAELEPGDAIYIPSMWWHHVEGMNALNVLINYWWRRVPAFMDTPVNALEYALLCIRDLPVSEREAWRALFDYYVFDFDQDSVGHIPQESRGILDPFDDLTARKLRAQLLKKLNR
ncbi:MAG TPA: cupin-like domain-containing protein [Xanthomonadales bacterium]|nr:cupin-like domain-containing protein [Xanthomonadales bacterium]